DRRAPLGGSERGGIPDGHRARPGDGRSRPDEKRAASRRSDRGVARGDHARTPLRARGSVRWRIETGATQADRDPRGQVELEISAPHPGQGPANALLDDHGELDERRVEEYSAEILGRFEASPEALAEPEAHWGGMLVDYAAHTFGTTAESLSPAEVHELVFE